MDNTERMVTGGRLLDLHISLPKMKYELETESKQRGLCCDDMAVHWEDWKIYQDM